jgi:hypothetical protein
MAWEPGISAASKVFAIVVPAVLVGISFSEAVARSEVAWLAVNDILCELFDSVCLYCSD